MASRCVGWECRSVLPQKVLKAGGIRRGLGIGVEAGSFLQREGAIEFVHLGMVEVNLRYDVLSDIVRQFFPDLSAKMKGNRFSLRFRNARARYCRGAR